MPDTAFHVRHPPRIYQYHVNIYCLEKIDVYRISILCIWVLIAVFITLTESSDPSPLLLDKSQMLSLIYHVSRVIRASCHNIMKCMIRHENNQYLYIYIYLQRFMAEVLFINCGGVNEGPNQSPRCEWRCAIAPLIFLKALFVRFLGGGALSERMKGFKILQSHCMKYSSIPESVACFLLALF